MNSAGKGTGTVQRRLSGVRTFFRFLVRERALSRNPALDIQAPRTGRPLPHVLDADRMAKLFDIPGDDLHAVRDRAIMELLYSSARRLAELAGLDLRDVDLRDRTARVLGKGSKTRIVPVGSFAVKALSAWLRVRRRVTSVREPALFVTSTGGRLGRRAIHIRIAYWARRQGIGVHVHPHLFRHSAATRLLESWRRKRRPRMGGKYSFEARFEFARMSSAMVQTFASNSSRLFRWRMVSNHFLIFTFVSRRPRQGHYGILK